MKAPELEPRIHRPKVLAFAIAWIFRSRLPYPLPYYAKVGS